jgi:hypothetical protein
MVVYSLMPYGKTKKHRPCHCQNLRCKYYQKEKGKNIAKLEHPISPVEAADLCIRPF